MNYAHFLTFSVLISNININRHNSHKQKAFEILNNFKECESILVSKNLQTIAL